MNAVIYARASTGEQVSSCDQQVREGTERAKQLGLKIWHVYKDDGISGTRHDRPGYQAMLKAAENREFGILLLWKQSRLGRDSLEVERAIRRLEKFNEVRIITCDGYDTSACEEGDRKLTRGVKGLMDEKTLDDLRKDTLRGQKDQYLKGYWLGGRPYGYRLVEITSKTEKDAYGKPKRIGSRLEIDQKQAKIVQEVFERYAHGASPQRIAGDLNDREILSPGSSWNRTKRRCGGWARSGIWQMLRNPLYGGSYFWKRVQWTKTEKGRVTKLRKQEEWMGSVGNAPELAIVKPAIWKLVQLRLSVNNGKPKDERLQSGGRAVYMLSGILKCGECGAHFVMDSKTHYRCGSVIDGKACKNDIRVRRDVAESVILRPIIDELLAPEMIEEMVKEMRAYYDERMAEVRAKRTKVPAEVEELNRRIARLQERLKTGDPDLTAEELLAIIDKADTKRKELLSSEPETKRMDKVLAALPAAANQYRGQIEKGLQGNPTEAGRARVAVHKLLGDQIKLVPAKGGGHLVAHLEFQRAALLGGIAGSVGSGGRICSVTTVPQSARLK
jgi:DNA invertase Pin-like site-specific DNA recombinase